MSSYTEEYVAAAIPLLFDPDATVRLAKEEGMPGSQGDPRAANNGSIMVIDVRRGWDQCEWLTRDQRQAMLALAIAPTHKWAEASTGVPAATLELRSQVGVQALTDWLNSTIAEREEWEAVVEAKAYRHVAA